MKLSDKHKGVIKAMRKGAYLFENTVTSSARFCLGATFNRWGNIDGRAVISLINTEFLIRKRENIAINRYELTELGKTIEL